MLASVGDNKTWAIAAGDDQTRLQQFRV